MQADSPTQGTIKAELRLHAEPSEQLWASHISRGARAASQGSPQQPLRGLFHHDTPGGVPGRAAKVPGTSLPFHGDRDERHPSAPGPHAEHICHIRQQGQGSWHRVRAERLLLPGAPSASPAPHIPPRCPRGWVCSRGRCPLLQGYSHDAPRLTGCVVLCPPGCRMRQAGPVGCQRWVYCPSALSSGWSRSGLASPQPQVLASTPQAAAAMAKDRQTPGRQILRSHPTAPVPPGWVSGMRHKGTAKAGSHTRT